MQVLLSDQVVLFIDRALLEERLTVLQGHILNRLSDRAWIFTLTGSSVGTDYGGKALILVLSQVSLGVLLSECAVVLPVELVVVIGGRLDRL